jgi:pimeloyl-ACP methyl ester carboxylesterase
VYGSVRLGAAAVVAGLNARATVDTPSDHRARAIANGLWGDALGRRDGHLGIVMGIRDSQGSPITLGPELDAAFPTANAHLVVMVHGLMQTERSWHGTGALPGLFHALEAEPGLTSISVRYNTELPVATNGAQLAKLIEAVHASWPVPVRSISLVGHSMGGLVALSAVANARRAGYEWIDSADDVVTIGSPHRGAPLEKFVHVAARGLGMASHTRPLAEFLETRSQGIKTSDTTTPRSRMNRWERLQCRRWFIGWWPESSRQIRAIGWAPFSETSWCRLPAVPACRPKTPPTCSLSGARIIST